MGGDDDSEYSGSEGSYYWARTIICSVTTFKVLSFIWGFLSLTIFIIGLYGLFTDEGVFLFMPDEVYVITAVFGGISFFVVLMGMVGACAKVEIFFICYLFLMSLLVLAQVIATIFLGLYFSDVGTIDSVDNGANAAQRVFEDQLVIFAQTNNNQWINTQNGVGCCGISLFLFPGDDLIDDDQEILQGLVESGALCQDPDSILAVAAFRQDIDDGVNLQDGVPIDFIENGVEDNLEFFCNAKFDEIIGDVVGFVIAFIAILLLLQVSAIIAGSRMYWVPWYRGGWMFEEEELAQQAREKGIKMPEKQEPAPGGNRVLSTLRNGANRLSFRVQNAVTANPNVPQGAGFLKRLSYRNPDQTFGMPGKRPGPPGFGQPAAAPPTTGFGQPGAAPPNTGFGNRPPAPPGFGASFSSGFKRLSQNLAAFGNSMKGKVNRPMPPSKPKPPPGFAGVPDNNPALDFGGARNQAPSFGKPPPPVIAPTSNNSWGQPPSNNFSKPAPARGMEFSNNTMWSGPASNNYSKPAPARGMEFSNNSNWNQPPSNNYSNPPPAPRGGQYSNNRGTNLSLDPPGGAPLRIASSPKVGLQKNKKPSGGLSNFYSKPKKKPSKNKKTRFGKKKTMNNNAPKVKSPLANMKGGGGLLAQIQQGKGLKPTITDDRSAPKLH